MDQPISNGTNINDDMVNVSNDVCCPINSTNFDQDNMNVKANAINKENNNKKHEHFHHL